MNTADKLVEIAENVSKVHDAGFDKGETLGRKLGYELGYGYGYDEGLANGHIDIIDELLGGAW